jgi:threonine dehydrogenase-like Zn-dependent dehydrogenase
MKALVYYGPGKFSWEEKPNPTIQEASDVIVKISKTTICGTDLAILRGGVPTVSPGRIIGHEATGHITAQLISHHFRLDQIMDAYQVFQNAAQEQAIKIVLSNDGAPAPASSTAEAELIRQIVAEVLENL